jgi:hypothetical protein
MNFPNRGDYDPRYIFKRPQDDNVVTGASWMYQTSYQKSFNKAKNNTSNEDLLSMKYIKERKSPKKHLHIGNNPEMVSNYQ